MNSTPSFEGDEIIQVQNFNIVENFALYQHNVCEYSPSPQMLVFVVVIFLLVETVGNFLLFCMIIYEKYGMDSQKRTVTNQLLSTICVNLIGVNCVFMTISTINILGLQSKTNKSISNCFTSQSFLKIVS